MNILNWVMNKGKGKQSIQEAADVMFPTDAHLNAAENMYGVLDPSQGYGMDNSQWRWLNPIGPDKPYTHPWQLPPNAFHDMLYTAEDMPKDIHNAMWRDYYTMNNLPAALNTQPNIDMLVKAAGLDDSPYRK